MVTPRKKRAVDTATECIIEMFRRVGLTYPAPEITKHDKWYTLREWTTEEENDFRDWMKKKLKKDCKYMSAKHIDYEVAMFLLNYGWKHKE